MSSQLSPEELEIIANAEKVIRLFKNPDFIYAMEKFEEEVKARTEELLDSEDLLLDSLIVTREFVRGLRYFKSTLQGREEDAKNILRSHGLLED